MKTRNHILIICLGALLFLPMLGHVHLFDWDEINFAESAREMLVTHKYTQVQINFQPFNEKPPLFMWLQALSMAVFGVNEFAARLPNAIVGIITLLVLFNIGSKLIDDRFGWLWVLCYIGSFLPHFYFKTGLIDPLFNLFIFSGIYQFMLLTGMQNFKPAKSFRKAMLAGLFIGLGILTKGPVALLVTLFCLFFYWASFRFRPMLPFRYLVVFFISAFIVSCAWFGIDTVKHGPGFLLGFIQRQIALFNSPDAGHGGPFYYHFVVLFFGCFPASLFMFSALRHEVSETYGIRNMKTWMIILLVSVLFIFTIVKTKIIHYSSLAYFPITFLAAYGIYKMLWLKKTRPRFLLVGGLLIISVIIGTALTIIPYLAKHINLLEPYIADDFGRESLKANVSWSGWEVLVGIAYLMVFIVGLVMFARKNTRFQGILGIFLAGVIGVQFTLYVFAAKIEGYTQRAAIDFFIARQHEDCYTDVWGYHSYAQYFYTQKQPPAQDSMLVSGKYIFGKHLGKPVYLVIKAGNNDAIRGFTTRVGYHIIGAQAGFVFLKMDAD